MIKTIFLRSMNFVILSVMLPFASGCNGGGSGGGTASLGSLFGASSGGATLTGGGPGGAGAGAGVGADALATIHQPEPTTMLLVGGGMMAMAYFRNRNS